MDPNDDCDLKRFACLLGHAEIRERMPGQQQNADPVRTADLTPMDRYVLDAVARIASDQQACRDIGSAVALVVLRDW